MTVSSSISARFLYGLPYRFQRALSWSPPLCLRSLRCTMPYGTGKQSKRAWTVLWSTKHPLDVVRVGTWSSLRCLHLVVRSHQDHCQVCGLTDPGGGLDQIWRLTGVCATAGQRQNPPMSKGGQRTRQAPCLRKLSPWRPVCMDPHPISYHLPCPASCYSNLQVVIALLCKYILCQLPQLSISGYQNRWKYAIWTPVVGMKIKYKTQ